MCGEARSQSGRPRLALDLSPAARGWAGVAGAPRCPASCLADRLAAPGWAHLKAKMNAHMLATKKARSASQSATARAAREAAQPRLPHSSSGRRPSESTRKKDSSTPSICGEKARATGDVSWARGLALGTPPRCRWTRSAPRRTAAGRGGRAGATRGGVRHRRRRPACCSSAAQRAAAAAQPSSSHTLLPPTVDASSEAAEWLSTPARSSTYSRPQGATRRQEQRPLPNGAKRAAPQAGCQAPSGHSLPAHAFAPSCASGPTMPA